MTQQPSRQNPNNPQALKTKSLFIFGAKTHVPLSVNIYPFQCRHASVFGYWNSEFGETSLMVQWHRFHTPHAGDPGSIPSRELDSIYHN